MSKFLERINNKNPQQLGHMIKSYKAMMKKIEVGLLYMSEKQELKLREQYAMMLALREQRKSERTYADRSGLVGYWDSFC